MPAVKIKVSLCIGVDLVQ